MPNTDIIKNIVLAGGGLRGIAYIGFLRAMEEFDLIKSVERFSGASIGGIAVALISIGYGHVELYDFVRNFEYDLVSDIQLTGILSNFGLETGNKIEYFLQSLIFHKTGKRELTFKEHFELTGKTLVLNATCLNTGKIEHFSAANAPDMPIYLALRMTISLPLLIAPVKYNGKLYADGGMLENFPLKLFPASGTLGVRFSRTLSVSEDISSFETYCVNTLSCIYREMNRLKDEKITGYKQILIDIPFNSFQIDIDKKSRKTMYRTGYNATKKQLLELGYQPCKNNGLIKSIMNDLHIIEKEKENENKSDSDRDRNGNGINEGHDKNNEETPSSNAGKH